MIFEMLRTSRTNPYINIRVLSLPISVAPTKVLLVPLSGHPSFAPVVKRLSQKLRTSGISNRIDNGSASIGKRYARNDELGTPFSITVDFETIKNGSLTLRERDTTRQARASESEVLDAIKNLVNGSETWHDVSKRLPEFTGQDVDD
jgi:glycyl-tRNA synthetase